MISSEYLYGGLDVETAKLQKALFERKKAKAHQTLGNLKEHFNLLDFSQAQSDLQLRVDKIKKAVVFCEEQIDEAKEVIEIKGKQMNEKITFREEVHTILMV